MSYLYTIENQIRKSNQNYLLDLLTPIVNISDELYYYPYLVSEAEEMRIDLICLNIYGHTGYIDEILTLNNIINPWSIKSGSIIYYVDEEQILLMQTKPKADEQTILNNLVNPNKDTKKDPNRQTGENLTPTIKPAGLKDVEINYDKKTVKIIDKLK